MNEQDTATATRGAFGPEVLELTPDGGGRLVGSACSVCGAHYFPQRRTCGRCLCAQLEPVGLSTSGRVYTYTVVHQSTPEFPVPYVLAYVDLPERVRVPTQLSGCAPADVRIGMPVSLVVEPFGPGEEDDAALGYRFQPQSGG